MDPSSNTNVFEADAAGRAQGAFAMLAALHYHKRTGKGQLIELAQAENMIAYTGRFFMDYAMNGRNAATLGNRHTHAVQGCYPRDGIDRWINITLYDESDWRAFCDAVGSPEWTTQAQFATHSRRGTNQGALNAHIAQWTQRRDHYETRHLLQAAGVAAGPVMDQRDAFADPRLKARGIFEEAYHDDVGGSHIYVGAPFKMSKTPARIRRGPMRLGQDNEYAHKRILGVSDAEYADMERAGHIGIDFPREAS